MCVRVHVALMESNVGKKIERQIDRQTDRQRKRD